MCILNEDWKPEFGTIFTWFAMDRFGRIAVMVNNCWGDIPKVLLKKKDIEYWLDKMTEYMWGESKEYNDYPENKNGSFSVDFYSAWAYKKGTSKSEVFDSLLASFERIANYSEANLAINRGFFEYYAVEGSQEGEDYPVGYHGETKMGDYYRYLVPTMYASINDFPEDLKGFIAASNTLDFERDRILFNDRINEYFSSCYLVKLD